MPPAEFELGIPGSERQKIRYELNRGISSTADVGFKSLLLCCQKVFVKQTSVYLVDVKIKAEVYLCDATCICS
jgi:hypothetical protein